jgi:hypothetical protein
MGYEEVAGGSRDPSYKESIEFDIWLNNGINRGWVTEPFCYMHDDDPYVTQEDLKMLDEGEEPCAYVVKIIGSE